MVSKVSEEVLREIERLYDPSYSNQNRYHSCPSCIKERKSSNRKTKTLSLKGGDRGIIFNCHHCGIDGCISQRNSKPVIQARPTIHRMAPMEQTKVVALNTPTSRDISPAAEAYLATRMISPETAKKAGVFTSIRNIRGQSRDLILFPYTQDGSVTAYKARTYPDKEFTAQGAAATFWGFPEALKALEDGASEDLIILEGELDLLATREVGIEWSMSVPNGAPKNVSDGKIDPKEDGKFRFVWTGKDTFDKAKRIILACDGDEPGQALAEELARRIGKARCWQAQWPAGCKDANDVLVKLGPDKLKEVLANPTPWPLAGIFDAMHYADGVKALYNNGLGKGLSTGFGNVDDYYTVVPGHLTVVTGIPGSGKSTWLNAVMMNMAMQHNWSFAIYSTEFTPELLIASLAALYLDQPFFDGDGVRLSEAALDKAIDFINDRFIFISGDDGPTYEEIITRLEAAVLRMGVRGVVVDPASYIRGPTGDSGTEFVGQMLEAFKRFCRSHEVNTWLVAHPFKIKPREDGTSSAPKGYEISGSSHYFNRPDCGITIHRPADARHITEVHVWKMRFHWVGREGKTDLYHDRGTGRFSETPFAPQLRYVNSFAESPLTIPASADLDIMPWEEP